MAHPVRCYAGLFYGGYPYHSKPTDRGSRHQKAEVVGIQAIVTSTTADTATELELEDYNAESAPANPPYPYQTSKVDRLFQYKASADDSSMYFDFSTYPLICKHGVRVRTNTNCRPVIWVR